MRGMIVSALACAVFGSVGCSGSAKYVQQTANGGVIELKAGADQQEVAKLIESHLGKVEYTVEPMAVPQGSTAQAGAFNPNAPQSAPTPAGKDAPTYFKYSKKATNGVTPSGLPPVDMGIQQTGYLQQRPAMAPTPAPNAGTASMKPPAMFPQQ